MNIQKFINFTEKCPICNNDLKLYMSWVNGLLFKGESIPKSFLDDATYRFYPVVCDDEKLENEYVLIGNDGKTSYSNSNLIKRISMTQAFLFQICNEDGIKKYENNDDYYIRMPAACYYRSTPSLKLHMNDEYSCHLIEIHNEQKEYTVKNEVFSISKQINDVVKYYALSMDYVTKESTIWYYSISEEQKTIPNFKPNKFEKILPLLTSRPKFDLENREKMINRFDSWILVS